MKRPCPPPPPRHFARALLLAALALSTQGCITSAMWDRWGSRTRHHRLDGAIDAVHVAGRDAAGAPGTVLFRYQVNDPAALSSSAWEPLGQPAGWIVVGTPPASGGEFEQALRSPAAGRTIRSASAHVPLGENPQRPHSATTTVSLVLATPEGPNATQVFPLRGIVHVAPTADPAADPVIVDPPWDFPVTFTRTTRESDNELPLILATPFTLAADGAITIGVVGLWLWLESLEDDDDDDWDE